MMRTSRLHCPSVIEQLQLHHAMKLSGFCLSVRPSACSSLRPSVRRSACPSVRLSVSRITGERFEIIEIGLRLPRGRPYQLLGSINGMWSGQNEFLLQVNLQMIDREIKYKRIASYQLTECSGKMRFILKLGWSENEAYFLMWIYDSSFIIRKPVHKKFLGCNPFLLFEIYLLGPG